jgi:hypothetical protein
LIFYTLGYSNYEYIYLPNLIKIRGKKNKNNRGR